MDRADSAGGSEPVGRPDGQAPQPEQPERRLSWLDEDLPPPARTGPAEQARDAPAPQAWAPAAPRESPPRDWAPAAPWQEGGQEVDDRRASGTGTNWFAPVTRSSDVAADTTDEGWPESQWATTDATTGDTPGDWTVDDTDQPHGPSRWAELATPWPPGEVASADPPPAEPPPAARGGPAAPPSAPLAPAGPPVRRAGRQEPGARPRRRRRRALTAVTAVLVGLVLTASVTSTALVLWRGGDGPGQTGRTLSAPLDGRTRAGFQIAADVTTIRVRGGDLGGDLYRVATPADSPTLPEVVSREGQLVLRLVPGPGRGAGAGELDVQLSTKVTWALRLTGGATTRSVDASALTVSSVLVTAGSTRTDLTLPAPRGQVPVRIAGGVDELAVRVPAGAPVRVRVRAGAGRVTVDGEQRTGVAAGTAVATPDWTGAPDRYDIDLIGGATAVTVTRGR